MGGAVGAADGSLLGAPLGTDVGVLLGAADGSVVSWADRAKPESCGAHHSETLPDGAVSAVISILGPLTLTEMLPAPDV